MIREILDSLKKEDYKNSPPHLAKKVYSIICKFARTDNPYREIKEYYNRELLGMEGRLKEIIAGSSDSFNAALKLAITGNIIDFGTEYQITKEFVLGKLDEVHKKELKIDDSIEMYEKLKKADTLFYLGDNCGEIVIDKIFIGHLKSIFPNLNITYGVRGKSIINDVTLEDAEMVKMEEVAEVLDNGDGAPGTVIEDVKDEFKSLFYRSDIVIAKGQGNYETLSGIDREDVYLLFMAKCDVVAKKISVEPMSLICMESGRYGTNKKKKIK
jgi:uncharacterized protein with ATP-grasp and redox domains